MNDHLKHRYLGARAQGHSANQLQLPLLSTILGIGGRVAGLDGGVEDVVHGHPGTVEGCCLNREHE